MLVWLSKYRKETIRNHKYDKFIRAATRQQQCCRALPAGGRWGRGQRSRLQQSASSAGRAIWREERRARQLLHWMTKTSSCLFSKYFTGMSICQSKEEMRNKTIDRARPKLAHPVLVNSGLMKLWIILPPQQDLQEFNAKSTTRATTTTQLLKGII